MTDNLKKYHIEGCRGRPPIIIIDTPGFADTRGIEEDKIHQEDFRNFFKNELKTLTAVCQVVKANTNKLTLQEEYIINTILGCFAQNVAENFCIMTTFNDGKEPLCKETLKAVPSI